MANIIVHTVLPRGIGPSVTNFTESTMTAPASRTGILYVRNRAPGDLIMTITIPDGPPDFLGPRDVTATVPGTSVRFFALIYKLCDPTTQLITFTLSGDTSNAEGFVLERQQ